MIIDRLPRAPWPVSGLLAMAMLVMVLFPLPARAVEPDEMLADPELEARARDLSRDLRCVVCQNQSIDDSDAPLARDLRILVRERLKAGDSDRAVKAFLVARYGDYVLLRPRFSGATLGLWGAPVLALAGGGLAVFLLLRGRQGRAAAAGPVSPALSRDDEARLRRLLDTGDRVSDPPVDRG